MPGDVWRTSYIGTAKRSGGGSRTATSGPRPETRMDGAALAGSGRGRTLAAGSGKGIPTRYYPSQHVRAWSFAVAEPSGVDSAFLRGIVVGRGSGWPSAG